jgi:hypothetical protein
MRIFVLTATYELRVSRKNHLRDHPISELRIGHRVNLYFLMLSPVGQGHCVRKSCQIINDDIILQFYLLFIFYGLCSLTWRCECLLDCG